MSSSLVPAATLVIRPMSGSIGAEIEGLDLRRELGADEIAAVRAAFHRYGIIVMRDQAISPEQHMAFAALFGPFMDLPHIPRVPGFELLHQVRREADAANRRVPGEGWHTDSTFLDAPPAAVVMRAVDVPEYGGDTLFTSSYAAYDALSDGMKAMLEPLRAVHSATRVFGKESLKRDPILQLRAGTSIEQGERETLHPVIARHPASGRKYLYVNSTYTQRFESMTIDESRPLLEMLWAHAAKPEFGTRLRWRNDTVLVWDNHCTMHRAVPDFLDTFRYLQRATIAGAPPAK